MSHIVGIDLGTTNSLCAVFLAEQPRLIPNALGQLLTPSVIGLLEDGQILVGAAAKELQVTQPERCVSCFKRFMGSGETVELGDRTFTAPELSSMVLQSLKADAEKFLDETVSEAVITVPAYFNDNQRKATRTAGELAGLKVRRIVNEPTAAALTYGFHDRDGDKKLLVVDLGGGTFDVTLMEVFEGTIEIVSTAGENFLGGEDFTNRVLATILQKQGVQFEVAELKQPQRVSRLRQQCEAAKIHLADQDEATIFVPDETGELVDGGPKVTITRRQFAKIVQPLLERIAGPIGKALRDGDCQPEDVDEVILVGGATRMLAVREFLHERFQVDPLVKFNPDEVVCLGASVQAALIADDRAVDDMVMTDVCPHTLGVDTAKELGSQIKSGYFTPIIHRNSTIPTSKEQVFSTMQPNQQTVQIDVYQGEHRRVEKNLKLGELTVSNIPPGPAGQEIYIRFTYDLNGLIEVEAYAGGTGKKFSTVLTQHAAELSQDDVQAAIERMQQLKYYPREDMAVQRLLRLGERLVSEVSPFHRDQLEGAVDSLEHAMNSGDKEMVEGAQQTLVQVLSMLGYEEPNS
ncbi:MAG: molecular chaperone HscC [Planctomycetota bacterium]